MSKFNSLVQNEQTHEKALEIIRTFGPEDLADAMIQHADDKPTNLHDQEYYGHLDAIDSPISHFLKTEVEKAVFQILEDTFYNGCFVNQPTLLDDFSKIQKEPGMISYRLFNLVRNFRRLF